MKLIWCPAVTLDGNIASHDGLSDFPSDEDGDLFERLVKQSEAVIVGNTTFQQYKNVVFPIAGATTFVWTRKMDQPPVEGVTYIVGSPEEVVRKIEALGYGDCVLAGGTQTNNAFMKAGLINELYVTIYPLLFGKGMRLLTLDSIDKKLKLVDSTLLNGGIVRNHYSILNESN